MPRQLFVVKLSGSLFLSSEFRNICEAIKRSFNDDRELRGVFVAGGGEIARKYIAAGKSLGLDQATLDQIGIEVSRLNTRLIAEALSPITNKSLPKNLSEAAEQVSITRTAKNPRIVSCGGFNPGQSTNAVAALVAEKTSADLLINATDVDGVYDRDPARFKKAKKLEAVTPQELSKILSNESSEAGAYDLMDPIALKLISRSKIPTVIVKCDASVLDSLLHNRNESIGTRIVF